MSFAWEFLFEGGRGGGGGRLKALGFLFARTVSHSRPLGCRFRVKAAKPSRHLKGFDALYKGPVLDPSGHEVHALGLHAGTTPSQTGRKSQAETKQ